MVNFSDPNFLQNAWNGMMAYVTQTFQTLVWFVAFLFIALVLIVIYLLI